VYVRGFGTSFPTRVGAQYEFHPTSTRSEIAARAISHGAIPMGNPEGIRMLKKKYFSPRALLSKKFAFIVTTLRHFLNKIKY